MRAEIVLIISLSELLVLPVSAQQHQSVVETIEVTGQKPLQLYFSLREQKRRLFMQVFNQHINDEDLHFICKRQTPTGSKIPQKVCKNAFDWRIEQEIVQEEIQRGNVLGAYSVALMGTKEQDIRRKELVKTIRQLLKENKQFLSVYSDFKAADDAYKKAHRRKFGSLSKYRR